MFSGSHSGFRRKVKRDSRTGSEAKINTAFFLRTKFVFSADFVRSFFRFRHDIHNMKWIPKLTCQFSHILSANVKIFRLFFRFFDIFYTKSIAFLNAIVYNKLGQNLQCGIFGKNQKKRIGNHRF